MISKNTLYRIRFNKITTIWTERCTERSRDDYRESKNYIYRILSKKYALRLFEKYMEREKKTTKKLDLIEERGLLPELYMTALEIYGSALR